MRMERRIHAGASRNRTKRQSRPVRVRRIAECCTSATGALAPCAKHKGAYSPHSNLFGTEDSRFLVLPATLQPDCSWLARCYAGGAPDTETFIHNFCHLRAVFLYNPVNPRTLGTNPDTFSASSAFFVINEYLNHNSKHIYKQ